MVLIWKFSGSVFHEYFQICHQNISSEVASIPEIDFSFSKCNFSFFSLSGWLLRGRADFFAPWIGAWGWHVGISHPLDVQLYCLIVPWTSWTALAPSSPFFGRDTSAWKHLSILIIFWAWKKSDSRPNLNQLMGKFRKALRILPLATNRQENWQGLIQSWPKFQCGLAEIAASQQSFGISTRLCQRTCEQL